MPAEYTAILSHPVGVNSLWRAGRSRAGTATIYKTAAARAWSDGALLELRAAGWRPLPEGAYWVHLSCVLVTCRHDIDSCLKQGLDVVAAALEVNDGCIGSLIASKIPAATSGSCRI